MEKITVKPATSGLVVMDEMGRPIPDIGATVPRTIHIVRRIKDGDLEVVDAPATAHANKKNKAAPRPAKKEDEVI